MVMIAYLTGCFPFGFRTYRYGRSVTVASRDIIYLVTAGSVISCEYIARQKAFDMPEV